MKANKFMLRIFAFFTMLFLLFGTVTGCGAANAVPVVTQAATEVTTQEITQESTEVTTQAAKTDEVSEDGSYTSKEEVALYIHLYNHLPNNYITKKEAEALGWDSKKGNLSEIAPGKSIGGSYFGNYEEQLPKEKGRKYYECDIDYEGGYRGEKRIIFSNDGLIYYTGDHYKTFLQLYP